MVELLRGPESNASQSTASERGSERNPRIPEERRLSVPSATYTPNHPIAEYSEPSLFAYALTGSLFGIRPTFKVKILGNRRALRPDFP
jgi:hypothetical protein